MEDILEKKKKFDNYEIDVTDFTEEELSEINKMYKEEIKNLKTIVKNKILEIKKTSNQ